MAGSMWQQYYAPQIAARNRWVDTGYAGGGAVPRRSGRPAPVGPGERRIGIRARFAAAGAAAGSAVIAVLGVSGMHAYRGEAPSAPPAPVVHATPDTTTAMAGDGVTG